MREVWAAAHGGAMLRPPVLRCDKCGRMAVARLDGEALCKPHHEAALRKLYPSEVKAMRECKHPHYADGHCAEMACWNYYSKCPKHAYSGKPDAECSREKEENHGA